MGFDEKDTVVICVSPGIKGKWDVSEKGFEEPLASFDDKEDAYAYATELMKSKENATVLVEDEDGFSLLPIPGQGSDARDEANRSGDG
ncbi:DUF2188 domain-containing protein [Noviherbaspirillum sp.]|uniref:DUF2188 domain-containing protein n=1 Tax=Noviherbaspirillum sp. TaxID=1926288 RepID=UPI002B4A2525|nr:DUF2188 domain-containing protein [Noviherbaspirillum sp.]HJV83369.1 DUF2188 domain-containing protein [Noviherbaspirillum sp.]